MSSTVWRFQNADGEWRVSLAPDFIAIETTRYTSRNDFLGRFQMILEALQEHFEPRIVDRLGVRYIDRVTGENLERLPELVGPEVAGILGSSLSQHVHHSICENVFQLPEEGGRLLARWGLVPPNATVDPAAIEPLGEKSWLLDLDAYTEEGLAFDAAEVVARARRFAERIYKFFRWSVEPEFLRRYGGEP
jgi:uncharacterized protein (TIGR04255 family)